MTGRRSLIPSLRPSISAATRRRPATNARSFHRVAHGNAVKRGLGYAVQAHEPIQPGVEKATHTKRSEPEFASDQGGVLGRVPRFEKDVAVTVRSRTFSTSDRRRPQR